MLSAISYMYSKSITTNKTRRSYNYSVYLDFFSRCPVSLFAWFTVWCFCTLCFVCCNTCSFWFVLFWLPIHCNNKTDASTLKLQFLIPRWGIGTHEDFQHKLEKANLTCVQNKVYVCVCGVTSPEWSIKRYDNPAN